jgi:hypothetical protein
MANYEVESYISIPDAEGVLRYRHDEPKFEITIRNLHTQPGSDPPLLSAQVFLEADDPRVAAEESREHLKLFLDSLAFVANAHLDIRSLLHVADWTPALEHRDFIQYRRFPGDDVPFQVLRQELVDTVESLHKLGVGPKLRRALKWFALGVKSTYFDEQFQYFWFVVEIAAELTKDPTKVPDCCPMCGTALYCATCNETPMHRPFPKQAIQQLIGRIIRDNPADAHKTFLKVRNALLHGEDIAEIEQTIDQPMEKVVNILGRVAWVALLQSFGKLPPGRFSFLETNLYTHQTLNVGIVGQFSPQPPGVQPSLDDLPNIEISMIIDEQPNEG